MTPERAVRWILGAFMVSVVALLAVETTRPHTVMRLLGQAPTSSPSNNMCGNGVCDTSIENATNCPNDCQHVCGDGFCGNGEACPADCSTNPGSFGGGVSSQPWVCGDGVCHPMETANNNCPVDCNFNPGSSGGGTSAMGGSSPGGGSSANGGSSARSASASSQGGNCAAAQCGNNRCEDGPLPPACGSGTYGETPQNCPLDCRASSAASSRASSAASSAGSTGPKRTYCKTTKPQAGGSGWSGLADPTAIVIYERSPNMCVDVGAGGSNSNPRGEHVFKIVLDNALSDDDRIFQEIYNLDECDIKTREGECYDVFLSDEWGRRIDKAEFLNRADGQPHAGSGVFISINNRELNLRQCMSMPPVHNINAVVFGYEWGNGEYASGVYDAVEGTASTDPLYKNIGIKTHPPYLALGSNYDSHHDNLNRPIGEDFTRLGHGSTNLLLGFCQRAPECGDGYDNDGNKSIDMPNDINCSSYRKAREADLPACLTANVVFTEVSNTGWANAQKQVYVGTNPIPHGDGEKFQLKNGFQWMSDGEYQRNVPGLVVQREKNYILFGLEGFAPTPPEGSGDHTGGIPPYSSQTIKGKLILDPGTRIWAVEDDSQNPLEYNGENEDIFNPLGRGPYELPTEAEFTFNTNQADSDFVKVWIQNAWEREDANGGKCTTVACSDSIDNDGDLLVDYPSDPQCVSPEDRREDSSTPHCARAEMKIDFARADGTSRTLTLGDGTVVQGGQWFRIRENNQAINDNALMLDYTSLSAKRNPYFIEIIGVSDVSDPRVEYTLSIRGAHFTSVKPRSITGQSVANGLEVADGDSISMQGQWATTVAGKMYYGSPGDDITAYFEIDENTGGTSCPQPPSSAASSQGSVASTASSAAPPVGSSAASSRPSSAASSAQSNARSSAGSSARSSAASSRQSSASAASARSSARSSAAGLTNTSSAPYIGISSGQGGFFAATSSVNVDPFISVTYASSSSTQGTATDPNQPLLQGPNPSSTAGQQNVLATGSPAICGNGLRELGEICDDANRNDADACTNDCLAGKDARCSLDAQCSLGLCLGDRCVICTANSQCPSGLCDNGACISRQGNGALDAGEQCDDGNLASGDGCSRFGETEYGSPALVASATQTIDINPIPDQVNNVLVGDLRTITTQHAPAGETGPAAVAVMAGGASAGWAWVRRRRKKA